MIPYDAAICFNIKYDTCQVMLNQTKSHQTILTRDKRRIDFWVGYTDGVLYVYKMETTGIFKDMPVVEVSKTK